MLIVTNLVENYNLYIAGGLVRKMQHNADFNVTKQMQLKCHDRHGYGVNSVYCIILLWRHFHCTTHRGW